MILPAAMLVFLAGFHGALTRTHAIFLAIEGLVILILWNDRRAAKPTPTAAAASSDAPVVHPRWSPLAVLQFVLAIALSVIGGWAAVRGADIGSSATRVNYTAIDVASAGLLATTLLSPLLVLPMLGAGVDLSHRGLSWVAVSSQVGVALLNLCLLLPLVVVEAQYHPFHLAMSATMNAIYPQRPVALASATTTPTANEGDDADEDSATTMPAADLPLPLPLAVWRVDVVVLIALGMFLLPVALGRWSLTKFEGLGLIGGYIAYLLLAMSLGVRLI
jgi:hypothetical protein